MKVPFEFRSPLRKTLYDFWKRCFGEYRVIYKVVGQLVLVLAIIHRKNVHEVVGKREDIG